MTAPPLIDDEAIDQLRLLGARRPGLLQRVALRYIEDAEPRVAAMNKAVADANLEELTELAHALKGESRLLGAVQAAEAAETVEHHGRAGAASPLPVALRELQQVLRSTCAMLRELPECKSS
jgi:HPt (histidine-containing phosphotransfer) domain-containing protein